MYTFRDPGSGRVISAANGATWAWGRSTAETEAPSPEEAGGLAGMAGSRTEWRVRRSRHAALGADAEDKLPYAGFTRIRF
jgi:hypothetical protein